jgi:hypothetical protein
MIFLTARLLFALSATSFEEVSALTLRSPLW